MLIIKELKSEEFEDLVNKKNIDLPLWANPQITIYYELRKFLTIWKGDELKGIFVVPVMIRNNKYMVNRKFRFFPYVTPIIFEKDNVKRREIVFEFFKYLVENFDEISLPMFPEFKDIAPIQSLSIFAEYWHTHVLQNKLELNNVSSKLRNHINKAELEIEIKIDDDYSTYLYNRAIKGPENEIEIRSKSGINIIKKGKGFFIRGINKITGMEVGAIMVAYDSKWAYLLHSWRDEMAPRGIIPLLIMKATEICFDTLKVETFDFEGAVIQDIDVFFSGFNATIVPYAYLYWAKDKARFYELLNYSINIPGRLYDENSKGEKK